MRVFIDNREQQKMMTPLRNLSEGNENTQLENNVFNRICFQCNLQR